MSDLRQTFLKLLGTRPVAAHQMPWAPRIDAVIVGDQRRMVRVGSAPQLVGTAVAKALPGQSPETAPHWCPRGIPCRTSISDCRRRSTTCSHPSIGPRMSADLPDERAARKLPWGNQSRNQTLAFVHGALTRSARLHHASGGQCSETRDDRWTYRSAQGSAPPAGIGGNSLAHTSGIRP